MAPSRPDLARSTNKWAARIVPLLLTGIVGYVTWVYVALLAVNFLIHGKRTGAGIAVLVLYFLLLFLMVSCYLRVIQVVIADSGYVPLRRSHQRQSLRASRRGSQLESEKHNEGGAPHTKGFLDRTAVLDGRAIPPPGLEDFYSRDVFECDIDGLPRYCANCRIWKPDRSHHSSEVQRCVYKMDHFCPWAGGMISEANFKFFIQFCVYAIILCAFILITTAYFITKLDGSNKLARITWLIIIVLAGVFMLFSAGMAINSLHFACINSTTVDNLALSSRAQHFAVYSSKLSGNNGGYDTTPQFGTVTYPLPSNHAPPTPRRTFAILASPAGANAYRLSSLWTNLGTVMGYSPSDWFLPLKRSPCCMHGPLQQDDIESGSRSSMYVLGPAFDQMKLSAGLSQPPISNDSASRPQRHKRRRRRHHRRRSGGSTTRSPTNIH